jgi:GT2 family glycosyltransferase
MKLSVILVNQNMCSQLRLALTALKQAVQFLEAELIVVDNHSSDRSVAMLQQDFPDVRMIVNTSEKGFSGAVNQGIEAAVGEYVLVQHPTIITADDTLEKALNLLDAQPIIGGLSVRMLDAGGNYIAGSKKAMPNEWMQFFKFTGLSKLFSKSQLFSHHYTPGLSEEFENTETDVLNNCFMLLRRQALTQVGLFDERFKTYGHDIDLSYRIRLGGFKNFYFAKTFVIQQQVAPVSKWSWHFIKNFYGAMLIFAAKYLLKMPQLKLKAMPRWAAPAYELKQ